MKIIILSHYASSVQNFRGRLIERLISLGHIVKVFAPDWNISARDATVQMGAEIGTFYLSRSSLNPLSELITFANILMIYIKERPDIVFSYASKTNIWNALASRLIGVRVRVIMVEGMGYPFTYGPNGLTNKQKIISSILKFLYKFSFRYANTVLVLNKDDQEFIKIHCSLPSSRILLLNGIGLPLHDWPKVDSFKDPITFTMVGRLLREKGVFEFLKAASIVRSRYQNVRFFLLGTYDDNPGSIKQTEIEPWIVNGTVTCPGKVDVKPWLAQTSVFVLPSYREGMPRSTQEAMAMGRPIITTNVPGCKETVIDGINGYIVPPFDELALSSAMIKFIDSPDLIDNMGNESRRMAELHFDDAPINDKILDAFGI